MSKPATHRTKALLTTSCALIAAAWLLQADHGSRAASPPTTAPESYAAIDYSPVPGAPTLNRERLARLVTIATHRGARYVVLPELATTGSLEGLSRAEAEALAEPLDGPTIEQFGALARRLEVWIALSILERGGDGGYLQQPSDDGLYLTTVLLDDQGALRDTYRKILVRRGAEDGPADRGSYRAILDTVDVRGLRLGILSGDDLQTGVRRLANRGAETILITAGWTRSDPSPWQTLCRKLSEELSVNLVVANRRSTTPSPATAAQRDPKGGVYHHRGDVLRSPEAQRKEVLVAFLPRRDLPWQIDSALGLPASVPVPAHQPPTPEIAELGRKLFFDTNLSDTKTVSCATCHRPERAFTNGEARGVGVYGRHTKRNVSTLLNVAFKPLLRWDGYASMIENFVKYPISGYDEMSFHYLDRVVEYLRTDPEYTETFRTAMGVETIEFDHAARALATYLRTLISGDSPFDRFYFGGDATALSAGARRGLKLFTGKADCARCHQIGPDSALFMDFRYHFLGVGYDPDPGESEDIGLGSISTNDLAGYFQTPSLRDVAETAPYMHDGSMATLEEVIDFFDRGGDPVPGHTVELAPLDLTDAEKRDLLSFLRSLSGAQQYDERGLEHRPPSEVIEAAILADH